MNESKSNDTAKTCSRSALHDKWERTYRADENIPFYATALQTVIEDYALAAPMHVLDAGCGSGTKSLLLAERGFTVTGIDVSPEMLDKAGEKAAEAELQDLTSFQSVNLVSLSFDDATFDVVLCWGVLMHIPDIEGALAQLARVLKPGGLLIVSEGNRNSCQARFMGLLKAICPRSNERIEHKSCGVESWIETPDGIFLTRQADTRWLKEQLERGGCEVLVHRAGEFTEWYTRMPVVWIRRLLHIANAAWFHWIKIPSPAVGNLIVVQKMEV